MAGYETLPSNQSQLLLTILVVIITKYITQVADAKKAGGKMHKKSHQQRKKIKRLKPTMTKAERRAKFLKPKSCRWTFCFNDYPVAV